MEPDRIGRPTMYEAFNINTISGKTYQYILDPAVFESQVIIKGTTYTCIVGSRGTFDSLVSDVCDAIGLTYRRVKPYDLARWIYFCSGIHLNAHTVESVVRTKIPGTEYKQLRSE